jgi:putative endonuclease
MAATEITDPKGVPYAEERFPGTSFALSPGMKYVYLIRSLATPGQRYVGVTSDLEERLRTHNAGGSPHTSKCRPWELVTYVCFQRDERAIEFERYLKSGSGCAFANRRFWWNQPRSENTWAA